MNVSEEPLISVGRGFSAPANFKPPLDRKARAALMAHDSDAFNRWEAGQALATDVLLDMADKAKAAPPATDKTYLDAIGEVLARAEDDPAFAALMLVPPFESELALAKTPVDPDAIHAARMALIRAVADAHGPRLNRSMRNSRKRVLLTRCQTRRPARLRNAALRYLTRR